MSKTKRYWTGLDQLHNTPEFQESAENEFAPDASAEHLLESENLDEGKTKRRDFLKFLGVQRWSSYYGGLRNAS